MAGGERRDGVFHLAHKLIFGVLEGKTVYDFGVGEIAGLFVEGGEALVVLDPLLKTGYPGSECEWVIELETSDFGLQGFGI